MARKIPTGCRCLNEVRRSGKYALYSGEYQNLLTYLAEGCCESMLESNRILDMNNTWDEFSFFEVMYHWRMDRLEATSPMFYTYQETGFGFLVPQKSLYDAFVAEEGVDGYRLNQSIKTYDQMTELGVKLQKGKVLLMKDILHGNVVIQKKNLQLIQHVLLIIIVGCVMRKFCYWLLRPI